MDLEIKNERLEQALKEIRTLRGIIPVCAKCKKIRDPEGNWNSMEAYIEERSEANFSHGLCPACLEETKKKAESSGF